MICEINHFSTVADVTLHDCTVSCIMPDTTILFCNRYKTNDLITMLDDWFPQAREHKARIIIAYKTLYRSDLYELTTDEEFTFFENIILSYGREYFKDFNR